jgi:hypothetical protein
VKRFIQISFVVLLVIAIAVTTLSLTGTSSTMAGRESCTRVGWNSRSYDCLATAPQDLQGYRLELPPGILPQVGWNS